MYEIRRDALERYEHVAFGIGGRTGPGLNPALDLDSGRDGIDPLQREEAESNQRIVNGEEKKYAKEEALEDGTPDCQPFGLSALGCDRHASL